MRRLAVVLALAVAVLADCGGPSYPHPWCGPVLAQLANTKQSDQRQEANLRPYRHVPLVAKYIADGIAFDAAWAIAQSDVSVTQGFADMATASRYSRRWTADRKAIHAACKG